MKYSFKQVQGIFCCIRCPLYDAEYMICQHEDCVCKYISPRDILETRPSWCPLVEVNDINIVAVDVTKNDTSISEEIDDLDNININYTKFYKDYPDVFVEEFLGLELYPYQKVILRHIARHSKNKLKL